MRSLRPGLVLGFGALGALAAAHAAGCGGDGSNTSQSSASTGSGGAATGSSSGSAAGGMTTTGGGMGGGSTTPVCGDGKIEGTEQCDLGMANGTGVGCSSACAFDCMADADCNTMGNACAPSTCVSGMVQGQPVKVCQAGTPLASGASCGTNLFCVNGNCKAPACGDGVIEAPEECDDGNTTNGDGCDNDCKFTCLSRDPTRNCASTNPCVSNGTCGTNHECTAGANVANGTVCPGRHLPERRVRRHLVHRRAPRAATGVTTTGFCDGSPQACNLSTCGDGCVDASKGEQCDPPNGTTCSATCKTVSTAVCGNGTLEPGEQCDDGNLFDLDGCDSHCNYEAVARMTSVSIQGTAAPTGCTPVTNRLGAQSIAGALPLGQLNSPLQSDVTAGTVNVFMQFIGLTDLTGTAASGFKVGVLDGAPDPAKGTWPTAGNPEDWWFLADPGSVSMGLPTGLFTTTSLNAHNLTAGPSDISVTLNLGGTPALLSMRNAHIAATINGNPPPDVPAPPPAQLAAGLLVYQSITGSGTGQGLCGNITVDSLAKIPVPQALATSGTTACGACGQLAGVHLLHGDGNAGGRHLQLAPRRARGWLQGRRLPGYRGQPGAARRARDHGRHRHQADAWRQQEGEQPDHGQRRRLFGVSQVRRQPRSLHRRELHRNDRLPDRQDLHRRRVQVTQEGVAPPASPRFPLQRAPAGGLKDPIDDASESRPARCRRFRVARMCPRPFADGVQSGAGAGELQGLPSGSDVSEEVGVQRRRRGWGRDGGRLWRVVRGLPGGPGLQDRE